MVDLPQIALPQSVLDAETRARGRDVSFSQLDRLAIGTVADLAFVDDLQKKFANALGFLPKIALESCLENGHIRLATQNDDNAGYVLSRPKLRWCPSMRSITQAAVCMDAQRRSLGLALLNRIEAESRAAGQIAIQACCAVGLESNEFWHAAGFQPIVHMTPTNVRGREIICWRKLLTKKAPLWFTQLPAAAGYRARPAQSHFNPLRSMDALHIASRFTARKEA